MEENLTSECGFYGTEDRHGGIDKDIFEQVQDNTPLKTQTNMFISQTMQYSLS